MLKNKQTIIYGASMAALLFVLKWLELRLIIINHSLEVYIGAIALIFTTLGIWLALKLSAEKIKTVVVEKEVLVASPAIFVFNTKAAHAIGLSIREVEVLKLMAEGMSNKEIADSLFVSLNTIKTHSSNLFVKMDVERRTQAIDKARKLGLVA